MKKKLYKWALERELGSLRSAAKWDLEQATVASSHLLWINTPLPTARCCSRALRTTPHRVLVQGIIWFHPERGQNYERQKVKTQWAPFNPQLSLNMSWRVVFFFFFLWWQPSSVWFSPSSWHRTHSVWPHHDNPESVSSGSGRSCFLLNSSCHIPEGSGGSCKTLGMPRVHLYGHIHMGSHWK